MDGLHVAPLAQPPFGYPRMHVCMHRCLFWVQWSCAPCSWQRQACGLAGPLSNLIATSVCACVQCTLCAVHTVHAWALLLFLL